MTKRQCRTAHHDPGAVWVPVEKRTTRGRNPSLLLPQRDNLGIFQLLARLVQKALTLLWPSGAALHRADCPARVEAGRVGVHEARDRSRGFDATIDPILVLLLVESNPRVSGQGMQVHQLVMLVRSTGQVERSEEIGIAQAPIAHGSVLDGRTHAGNSAHGVTLQWVISRDTAYEYMWLSACPYAAREYRYAMSLRANFVLTSSLLPNRRRAHSADRISRW